MPADNKQPYYSDGSYNRHSHFPDDNYRGQNQHPDSEHSHYNQRPDMQYGRPHHPQDNFQMRPQHLNGIRHGRQHHPLPVSYGRQQHHPSDFPHGRPHFVGHPANGVFSWPHRGSHIQPHIPSMPHSVIPHPRRNMPRPSGPVFTRGRGRDHPLPHHR